MAAILSSATASDGRSPEADARAVLAFIQACNGQSGSGLVPQVTPASALGVAAAALARGAVEAAGLVAPGGGAVAAATAVALTEASGAADAIAIWGGALGVGVALAARLVSAGAVGRAASSVLVAALSLFGHAHSETPKKAKTGSRARMAHDCTRNFRRVSFVVGLLSV